MRGEVVLDHTDDQIGRLLDGLADLGRLDNTIVVLMSDNGASQEGGPFGVMHEMKFFNGILETPEEAIDRLDDIEIDRPLGRKLAARVTELVKANGGTNEKAARVLGLSHNAIGKLRKASPVARYTPETIEALARAAGVTRAELLAGKVAP